jgi:hypothetical protein
MYSLIMTHEENEKVGPPEYLKPYVSTTGKNHCVGFLYWREGGVAFYRMLLVMTNLASSFFIP